MINKNTWQYWGSRCWLAGAKKLFVIKKRPAGWWDTEGKSAQGDCWGGGGGGGGISGVAQGNLSGAYEENPSLDSLQ